MARLSRHITPLLKVSYSRQPPDDEDITQNVSQPLGTKLYRQLNESVKVQSANIGSSVTYAQLLENQEHLLRLINENVEKSKKVALLLQTIELQNDIPKPTTTKLAQSECGESTTVQKLKLPEKSKEDKARKSKSLKTAESKETESNNQTTTTDKSGTFTGKKIADNSFADKCIQVVKRCNKRYNEKDIHIAKEVLYFIAEEIESIELLSAINRMQICPAQAQPQTQLNINSQSASVVDINNNNQCDINV